MGCKFFIIMLEGRCYIRGQSTKDCQAEDRTISFNEESNLSKANIYNLPKISYRLLDGFNISNISGLNAIKITKKPIARKATIM